MNWKKKVMVSLVSLGRMSYKEALGIQEFYQNNHIEVRKKAEYQDNVKTGLTYGSDVLLIVEHDPVYTVGIRRNNYGENTKEILNKTGAEYYEVNRGGLITFHGPGQLVAYPIINLKNFKIGMRMYVQRLERTVIKTCAKFGITGKTSPYTGVWVGNNKICAMGVHGRSFITTHGLALNCDTDLTWFNHIVPCGIHGRGVTSLSKELNKHVTIDDTIPNLVSSFAEEFDCDIVESKLQI